MSDDGSGGGNPTSQEQSNIKQLVRDLLREEPSLLTPAVESAEAKATEKMAQSGSGKLCMASATRAASLTLMLDPGLASVVLRSDTWVDDMTLAGKYVYMNHLRKLARRIPHRPTPIPKTLATITSPLVVEEWRALLNNHPDGEFKDFFFSGMIEGFHIGFNYS